MQFMEGRVAGFDSTLHIPFVIVEQSAMQTIKTYLPTSIALDAITFKGRKSYLPFCFLSCIYRE
jgi:hypothetical protein